MNRIVLCCPRLYSIIIIMRTIVLYRSLLFLAVRVVHSIVLDGSRLLNIICKEFFPAILLTGASLRGEGGSKLAPYEYRVVPLAAAFGRRGIRGNPVWQ